MTAKAPPNLDVCEDREVPTGLLFHLPAGILNAFTFSGFVSSTQLSQCPAACLEAQNVLTYLSAHKRRICQIVRFSTMTDRVT